MRMNRMMAAAALALMMTAGLAGVAKADPIGTGFTYQGTLQNGGVPVTGNADFRFKLFDAASGGAQVGSTLEAVSVPVSEGRFDVVLDFGNPFSAGTALFIEIEVRSPAGSGDYTVLGTRQALRATPYALYSINPGPQGPQGEPGPQGPQGEQGPAGPPGTTTWSGITGIPAGFLDGVDNDTTYTAGTGLVLTGTVFSIGTHTHSAADITSGVLPLAFGGTGGATVETARTNLGVPGLTTQNIFSRGQSILLSNNDVGLTVRGATGQSADLQQWVDSNGTVVAKITSTGRLEASSIGGSTTTRTVSLSHKSFRPTRSSTAYTTDNGLQLAGAGVAEVIYPLDLPEGATITQVQFYVFDNSGLVMTVALSSQGLNAATITNVASATSPNNGAVQTLTLSPNHVVAATTGYYIRAFWDASAAANTMALFGAKITYTMP